MRITTWNLWSRNKNQKRAIEALLTVRADIMCLQEINEDAVSYLENLDGYHFRYCIDHYLDDVPFYNGILSRQKSIAYNIVQFKIKTKPTIAQSYYPRIKRVYESIAFIWVDYQLSNDKQLRIFNIHLASRTGPTHRLKQLKEVCSYFSKGDNVICGDFNSFASMLPNLLLGPWFFQYTRKDYFINEKEMLSLFCKQYNLKKTVIDTVTYPLLCMQLDHILVPASWELVNAIVYSDTFGSDHRLLMSEVGVK